LEKYISLSELNFQVKEKIEQNFSDNIFVVAEINELRESRGHAYLELIEKDEDENIKAKAKATIWARIYSMLKPYFETSTGHKFEAGIKVLISVKAVFHEVYGYSLNVIDIDPTYTIGEIEKKRLMIIKRLEEEGVTDMNKELDFPVVPQRIAVISSDTAAGYGDFINQLNKSPFNFYVKLFESAMQGEKTEVSVINALEKIYEEEKNFDIVVIIRGGGSKSDLSWFDSYKIAVNIAQFPLPVLTGIGHERDAVISDIVAYESLNTPTAVAEYIINTVSEFYNYLNSLSENFAYSVENILSENKNKISELGNSMKFMVSRLIMNQKNKLELLGTDYEHKIKQLLNLHIFQLKRYPEKLKTAVNKDINTKIQYFELLKIKLENSVSSFFREEKHKLALFEQKNNMSNPSNILKAGYSYTLSNGKLLRTIKDVKKGDELETFLYDGKILSTVKK